MKPIACVDDGHDCPLVNPDGRPHVGGPVTDTPVGTVFVAGKTVAVAGAGCKCEGPPDQVVVPAGTVWAEGKRVAADGAATVHGGAVRAGSRGVWVG